MIRTLSDAVTIVEFLISHQGKSVDDAIKEADIPLHLREQVVKYFAPPLDIVAPDLIVDRNQQLPKCDPENDSTQQRFGSLQRYLIDVRSRPKSIVGSLAESSLSIIRRFPKPEAAEQFQVRGLVLGYIQSGKTASMAALISRAADEGYKLFIVLGGLWKDLRAQTQKRLDQEIADHSDNSNDGPFIEYDPNLPKWVRLTRSGLDGDFTSGGPNDLNPLTPKLAVIKKNTKIEALTNWLKETPVSLRDLPALIIDDEADQGSINTNYNRTDDDGEPIDPSATNRRIRELLAVLPKSVYVGYTATPFANVLIDAEEDDLYPKDFIVSLPEPADYFGPRKLFGLGLDPSDLSPVAKEKPALDIIRYVKDTDLDQIDEALERNTEKCPDVLSDALIAFLLSCCGRLARGQDKEHFSMLVHPSQKTDPHRIFATAIGKELEYLKAAATYPKKLPDLMKRAHEMWDTDFRRVTHTQDDPSLSEHDFDTVWKFAKSVLDEIEIKVLNIYSEDALDYSGVPKRYIVVGGNRLSRGLTLEGLSVSVFTRNANQYDTLLQMGRWFGYRPQYADLTRIYVDKDLADRFAELARVEDELRADIKKYAQEPDPPTPLDLKPLIRTHPAMAITSRTKMGAGTPIHISFQNTSSETVAFPVDQKNLLEKNLNAGKGLISHLEKTTTAESIKGTYIWKDIPSSVILEFLQNYEFSRNAREVNRINLTNYIKRQNEKDELLSWDIVLPRGSKDRETYAWGKNVFANKVHRSPLITTTSVRQLKSPSDITSWREYASRDPKDPTYGALLLYLIDKNSESPEGRKFFSDRESAEDLLGLVFVFPESKSNATIEYVSQ